MFQTTNHFLARKVAKSNWAASLFPDVSSLPPELATNAVGQYVQQKLCKMIVIHFACVWWYQRASKMAKGAKWTWEQRNRGSHLPLKSCFWPHRPFSHELKLKKIKETSFFKLIPHIWWLNYQHFGHVGVKSLFWNFYVVQHAKCYQNSKVHDWSATWAYNQTPPTCSRWHSRWPLGDRNGLAGADREDMRMVSCGFTHQSMDLWGVWNIQNWKHLGVGHKRWVVHMLISPAELESKNQQR